MRLAYGRRVRTAPRQSLGLQQPAGSSRIAPKRRASLQAYMEHCADVLGLNETHIVVSDTSPEDDESILSIDVNPKRHAAVVFVGSFFETDAEEQRHVVAHELAHVVQGRLTDWVEDDSTWSRGMPELQAAMIRARISEELEIQADRFGIILAQLLPMPEGSWE